jgi:hypothetical protein
LPDERLPFLPECLEKKKENNKRSMNVERNAAVAEKIIIP